MRNDRRFAEWIDTFVDEKGLDTERLFEVEGPSGLNIIPLGVVVAAMKAAPAGEQEAIKAMLVKLDFINADCNGYFGHLAKALVL
jgi:hypothetical protein